DLARASASASISRRVGWASRSRTESSRDFIGSRARGISHLRMVHPYWGAAAARYGSARSVISLAAAISNLSSPLHRQDLAARSCLGGERRPLLHQPAPFLEQITTLIRLFGLAADGVRERHFDDLSLD